MEEISNQLRFSFTCSKEFQELYNKTKLENLQQLGIDRESLDIGTASYRYFTKGFTIDDNANALNFGAGNYEAEIGKPWLKMDNVYMLHKKLLDYRRNANRILNKVFDGEIYIHDLHGLLDRPYCLGISTGLMRLEGLPFSDLRSKPAKYSSSFMSQAGELIFALSQQFIGACYDDKTEVLTDEGFIYFSDLTYDKLVASVKDNVLYYVKPSDIQEYDWITDLIEIKQRSVSLKVTPEHYLYCRKDNKNAQYKFYHTNEIEKQRSRVYFKNQIEWNGKEEQYWNHDGLKLDMDLFLKFLGWFISEGWTHDHHIGISNKNNNNILEISSIIRDLGFKLQKSRKTEIVFANKTLFKYLKMLGTAPNKFIPQEFMELSKRQLSILISSLVKGDGHIDLSNRRIYYTTSKKLADQVQEIFLKLGKNSTLKTRNPKKGGIVEGRQIHGKHIAYEVHERIAKECSIYPKRFTRKKYHGKVYCCTVPEHILCIRRNGKVMFCGNTAQSDLLVQYASFLKNEEYKTDKDIIQDIQRYIWIVNQKLRSSTQSPFTNITIYDKFLLEKIIMESAIDVDLEVVQHVQNLWMEYFGVGNDGMPFRFPVTSINLQTKNNQVLDIETLENSVNYGHWLGAFNYYAGEDTKFTSCFRANTKVLTKGSINNIQYSRFPTCESSKKLKVLSEKEWIPAKFIKVPSPKFYYQIRLENGQTVEVTGDHPHITQRGTVRTDELLLTDYVPFSTCGYDGEGGNYNLGRFVGIYIAEGWKDEYRITITNTDNEIINFCKTIAMNIFGSDCSISIRERENKQIQLNDKVIATYMSSFVSGNGALNKGLTSKVFRMSKDFRRGVIDGWYQGDGKHDSKNSMIISTSSLALKEDCIALFSSLGYCTSTRINSSSNSSFSDNPNYLIRKIIKQNIPNRWYLKEEKLWVKIRKIEQKKTENDKYFYDFLVESKDHLFQLATGLITHNCCRLISDIDELRNKFVDSWGAGFNLGSMRVCTLNTPYIAIKSIESNNDFFTCLEDTLYDTYDILKVQREMIKKKIDMNFIPVFKPLEWLNEKMFFSTFGVLGMWEAGELLTNSTNSTDVIKMIDKVVTYIDKFSKKMSEEDFLTNVEFIPGESASYKLANAINNKFGGKYKYELLSNQIVPLDSDVTMPERIKMTGKISKKFSGGSLLHLNFNEQIDTPHVFQKLIENSIKFNVNHLAVNYVFSICKDFHGFRGDVCPICNSPKVDDVSRTVGYYTPVSRWNKVRQAENRQWY